MNLLIFILNFILQTCYLIFILFQNALHSIALVLKSINFLISIFKLTINLHNSLLLFSQYFLQYSALISQPIISHLQPLHILLQFTNGGPRLWALFEQCFIFLLYRWFGDRLQNWKAWLMLDVVVFDWRAGNILMHLTIILNILINMS